MPHGGLLFFRYLATTLSSASYNKALKILSFESEQTGHGFRGRASTVMNEERAQRYAA